MDNKTDRIIPLEDLDDFKVADGDPDVRGWDVVTADGRRVGGVDDLLIDREAMKVRYLDVEVDDDLLTEDTDRHILVPIGYARLDEESDRIFVDQLNAATLSQIPEYRVGGLTRDYETSLHGYFATDAATTATDRDFYDHPSYSTERFYGTRRGGGQPTETFGQGSLAKSVGTDSFGAQRSEPESGTMGDPSPRIDQDDRFDRRVR